MAARSRLSAPSTYVFAASVALVAAMALDTKVVKAGAADSPQSNSFSAATYGQTEFPKVRAAIVGRALDAATLATALDKDQAAAAQQYGVTADAGPEFSVKFTGKVGKQDSGVYEVSVPGIPSKLHISVQTGPAIVGTDLRDGTGTINFQQFTNQIDYQNAGSALNKEMKEKVLSSTNVEALTGKTISVVGAFELDDPTNWTVTPVKLDVQ